MADAEYGQGSNIHANGIDEKNKAYLEKEISRLEGELKQKDEQIEKLKIKALRLERRLLEIGGD